MMLPFDIFRTEQDGRPLWVEAAATVEAAHARVLELANRLQGEYFILNQRTRAKIRVRHDDLRSAPLRGGRT